VRVDRGERNSVHQLTFAYSAVGVGYGAVIWNQVNLVTDQRWRGVEHQRSHLSTDVEDDAAFPTRRELFFSHHRLPLRRNVVAAVRRPEVRERREEREAGPGDAVADVGIAPSGVKVGSTSGIVAPAIAWSSMVTTSSVIRRPFGYPPRSPPRTPSAFGELVAGIAKFSRSMSAWVVPVKVEKVGDTTPAGIPVSRIASRSARAWSTPRDSGKRRVEHVQETGELGLATPLA